MSNEKCCKCKTGWTTEIHQWDLYLYGINDGGKYLGAGPYKTNLPYKKDPTYDLCEEGGLWKYINPQKNPKLFENELYYEDLIVKIKLIREPTSTTNCSCIFTAGGKLVDKTLKNQYVYNLGYFKKTKKINGEWNKYYWQYYVDQQPCGTQEFGYEIYQPYGKAYVKVYDAEWEADHTCCGSNSPYPYNHVDELDVTDDIKNNFA